MQSFSSSLLQINHQINFDNKKKVTIFSTKSFSQQFNVIVT